MTTTSSFQRMIVIPQEEYLQMTAVQNARQPLTQHYYNLESKHQDGEYIKDPYERLLTQSETLDEMKRLKEQMRNNLSIATPKPYQSRAKALFENVSNFIKYNERGEILDKENKIIPRSRIEDLIQHAVRDRRRNILPVGWSHFLNLLRDHNIPKSVLNRDTLQELENADDYKPKSSSFKTKSPQSRSRVRFMTEDNDKASPPVKRRRLTAKRPSKQKRQWKPTKKFLESFSEYK